MREPVTADHLQAFMKSLAAAAKTPSRVYLVGGASSVLLGWRTSTIDIDLKIIPESDEILRSLPRLKEQLHLNIELASPDDFIPELPGWQERSRFIQQEGRLSFIITISMPRHWQRLNVDTRLTSKTSLICSKRD